MKQLKLVAFSLILTFVFTHVQAQKNEKKQKMEAAKIEFITQKLNLSPEQAEKFWPVFNEFDVKRKEIRKSRAALRPDTSNVSISDEQLKKDMDNFFSLKQKEIDLEKEYYGKFQKVISIRQVSDLYRSEKLFAVHLLKKLGDRKKHNNK